MLAVRRRISSYWLIIGAVSAVFLVSYLLAEALQAPYLTSVPVLTSPGIPAALISVSLLTADTLLPVPSSLIMVANGTLFGLWVGAAISMVGNILGFLLAYWLGHRGSPLIQRFISPHEIDRGNRVIRKWGVTALVLTRPLPILAETTTLMAGVAQLPFAKSLVAVAIGSLPGAALYAWAGSHVRSFDATAFIFLALIVLALIAWFIDKRYGRWV